MIGVKKYRIRKHFSIHWERIQKGMSVSKEDIQKPYPNEHACRIGDPDSYQEGTFRRMDEENFSIILAKPKGSSTMDVQSYRYSTDSWNENEARAHCKEKGGMFEPAVEKEFTGEFDSSFVTSESILKEDMILDEDTVLKAGTELRLVSGIVLEPDTEDLQGDIYDAEEIRKTAHEFMTNYTGQGNGWMHETKGHNKLKIVESYIAPVDMNIESNDIKKGTWLMTTLVLDDKIWNMVKQGKITGYSIRGRAKHESAA